MAHARLAPIHSREAFRGPASLTIALLAVTSLSWGCGTTDNADAGRDNARAGQRLLATLPASDSQSALKTAEPFFQVVGGAFTDSRSAVLEGSTGKLHIFDLAGEPLGAFAGRGEGPGEFARPIWVKAGGAE